MFAHAHTVPDTLQSLGEALWVRGHIHHMSPAHFLALPTQHPGCARGHGPMFPHAHTVPDTQQSLGEALSGRFPLRRPPRTPASSGSRDHSFTTLCQWHPHLLRYVFAIHYFCISQGTTTPHVPLSLAVPSRRPQCYSTLVPHASVHLALSAASTTCGASGSRRSLPAALTRRSSAGCPRPLLPTSCALRLQLPSWPRARNFHFNTGSCLRARQHIYSIPQ
jgi:hypothetical protein